MKKLLLCNLFLYVFVVASGQDFMRLADSLKKRGTTHAGSGKIQRGIRTKSFP